MTHKRQAEGAEQRERIDSYLQRSGLAARSPRVVPLTGDASDRRYFRVLMSDGPSIVLMSRAIQGLANGKAPDHPVWELPTK